MKISKIKFNWFYFYYSLIAISFLIIASLIAILFIDQITINNKKVSLNENLFFGFYNLKIGNGTNEYYLNWIGILFSIIVIIMVSLWCYCFYTYKWSKNTFFFKKYELSIMVGLIIIFITFLLILNFINKSSINLKNVNLINPDWFNQLIPNKVYKYNYVYDLSIYQIEPNNNVVNSSINAFGITWIILLVLFILSWFSLFVKIEYNKNRFYIKHY